MKNKSLFALILLITLPGCANIGPSSIQRDRSEYSTAIAESWKEMMLLNIVKMRYADTPMFMEVGSIVNQYILEQQFEAVANLRSGDLVGDGLNLGGIGRYSDRPTITYSPLMGEKFTKSLLTPIPPHSLFMLIQSGWNAEFILRISLTAINDLYNSSGRRMSIREIDKDFETLLHNLSTIQKHDGMGGRLIERDSVRSVIFFKRDLNEEVIAEVASAKKLLGLDPNKSEYNLVYGSTAANDTEIAMLTRSIIEIIAELAQHIRVPEQHIKENRAAPGIIDSDVDIYEARSRVFIKSSKEKPQDVFLAVSYRNYWFYIEDTDFRSKRMFSFLLFLLSLAEGGSQGVAPVLTLPAG